MFDQRYSILALTVFSMAGCRNDSGEPVPVEGAGRSTLIPLSEVEFGGEAAPSWEANGWGECAGDPSELSLCDWVLGSNVGVIGRIESVSPHVDDYVWSNGPADELGVPGECAQPGVPAVRFRVTPLNYVWGEGPNVAFDIYAGSELHRMMLPHLEGWDLDESGAVIWSWWPAEPSPPDEGDVFLFPIVQDPLRTWWTLGFEPMLSFDQQGRLRGRPDIAGCGHQQVPELDGLPVASLASAAMECHTGALSQSGTDFGNFRRSLVRDFLVYAFAATCAHSKPEAGGP